MVSIELLSACSQVLAQPDVSVKSVEENNLPISWEIDSDDIAAAREAAETLSQITVAVEGDYGEYDFLRVWEIDADDIAAAREAARILAADRLASGELVTTD